MTQPLNDPRQSYPVALESSLFNEHGSLTVGAYQRILSSVSERALVRTGLDVPSVIARYGVSWVMLSMSMDIHHPIHRDGKLNAHTWHTTKTGCIYRRDTGLYDAQGALVLAAATFFSLLDMKTRKICRDPAVYQALTIPGEEELLVAQSRVHTHGLVFTPVEQRSVRPSWIDFLGHVNNTRYGELAYDALTNEQREGFSHLSRLELAFTHELLPGRQILMERADVNGSLFVRASLLPELTPSFVVKMKFEN